jgi:hypothetical protein
MADGPKLQFNVVVFNKVITISMNYEFLCELANTIELNKECEESFKGLLNSIDEFYNNPNHSYSHNEFTLVKHSDIYQLIIDSNYAKDLSSLLGNVLHDLRTKDINTDLPIDVIFAFVKRLEMAAFNHYRELCERQISPPVRQALPPKKRFPYNQYPPIGRRYNHS